jgi:hypothetical protein
MSLFQSDYVYELTPHEALALLHITSEWLQANPNIGGPCAQFVYQLITKIREHPYPEDAARDYQQLLQNYRSASAISTPAFACPNCGSGVELGPESVGGFCFTCLSGFSRDLLKTAGSVH